VIVRYSVFPRDNGYRVFGVSPTTGEWEDCQTLFGERDANLWITYPTEAAAEAAIAPLIKDDYLTSVDRAFNITQKEFDPSDF
jgi:hypothetical protein